MLQLHVLCKSDANMRLSKDVPAAAAAAHTRIRLAGDLRPDTDFCTSLALHLQQMQASS